MEYAGGESIVSELCYRSFQVGTTLVAHIVMTLQLTIVCAGGEPFPPGSRLIVEVRDTSYADAPATRLHRAEKAVAKKGRTNSISLPIKLTSVPDGTTVWAHVDVDGDGRVSKGDYVSMESYGVTTSSTKTTIQVKKVP